MEVRTSIKGKVNKRLTGAMQDYTVFLVSTNDYSHIPPKLSKESGQVFIIVTGIGLPNVPSVEIEYYGEWVNNKKYGLQFKADSFSFVVPKTERGMINFLKSKAFPEIGPKTAEKIVGYFKEKTFDVIKNSPEELLKVEGITPKKVGLISYYYKKNESFSELSVFLSSYGVGSDSTIKINDRYGDSAIDMIKKNPYTIQRIKGIGFYTCDKIARGLNVALDSYERIEGAILEVIESHVLKTGDTCILVDRLESETLSLLNEGLSSEEVSIDSFRNVARNMAEKDEIKFRGKKVCFLHEYEEAENISSNKIKELINVDTKVLPLDVISTVEELTKESEIKLSDNQKDAVKMALLNRVSIITGGPGTGKSTILNVISKCYMKLYHKEVILLAPTGKAARRMKEVSGLDSSTIHSKLHIFDGYEDDSISLNQGLIVVDESSMVDAIILSKLLNAVEKGSNLLFIGDVDQLPSIGPGNVLQDLIESNIIPVQRLTEIFRQKSGGTIALNAKLINEGNINLVYDDSFEFYEALTEDDAITKIKNAYIKEVNDKGVENVALLMPLRRSQNGRFKVVVDEINSVLHDLINPRLNKKYCSLNSNEYRVGDRVLQWKNSEKSSNGDIGEIIDIREDDGDICIEIKWDNGNTTIENRQTMQDITFAYALSIHKSQGSEYRSVIIPTLTKQKCQLFKRNLFYTAVTRAKEKVILIGDEKAIEYLITNCDKNKRITLLKERLKS